MGQRRQRRQQWRYGSDGVGKERRARVDFADARWEVGVGGMRRAMLALVCLVWLLWLGRLRWVGYLVWLVHLGRMDWAGPDRLYCLHGSQRRCGDGDVDAGTMARR